MRFFFEKLVVAYFFGPPCIRSTVSDGVSPSPEDGPEPARPPINLALFSHWFLNRTNLVSCCLTAVLLSFTFNGAGTNLKVGAPVWREAPENFFWSCPSTFLALKVQIVVLVSAFVMVSTVWSVSCLLFFYSRYPPCDGVGATVYIPRGVDTAQKLRRHWEHNSYADGSTAPPPLFFTQTKELESVLLVSTKLYKCYVKLSVMPSILWRQSVELEKGTCPPILRWRRSVLSASVQIKPDLFGETW